MHSSVSQAWHRRIPAVDGSSLIIIVLCTLVGLGLIFGIGLAVASERFKVDADPRIEEVEELLAGVNCGACGQAGCSGLAEALVAGEAEPAACPVCESEARQQIASVLGVELTEKEPEIAVLLCKGGARVERKADYDGVMDCRAAALVHGGPKLCSFGCLGLGTCVEVCPFEAVRMGADGLPEILEERCKGCRKCEAVCPKAVLRVVPISKAVHVQCRSTERGAAVKKMCAVGCIGCKKCEKACEQDAIKVEDFLATIDYEKCTVCGACVEQCPTAAIGDLREARGLAAAAVSEASSE